MHPVISNAGNDLSDRHSRLGNGSYGDEIVSSEQAPTRHHLKDDRPCIQCSQLSLSAMAVQKISILGKESIHVGFNLVQHIADTLLDTLPTSTYVLITDTNIAPLYLQPIQDTFTQATDTRFPNSSDPARPRFLTYTIPPGETTKTREGKAEIEDFLLRHRCTRDTVIIALGGGVIGDLVGFVAATLYVGLFLSFYVTDSNLFQHAWRACSTSADITPCYG